MRLPRVVARAALIAVLAWVAVPGAAGSRIPTRPALIDAAAFDVVAIGGPGTAVAPLRLDPSGDATARLTGDSQLADRFVVPVAVPLARDAATLPAISPIVRVTWHYDPNISWYGPGFWGQGTACGQTLTETTLGVAHRTLPCGTLVTFKYNGRQITVPVIDRGPYVAGRTWDLTKATCQAIGHCFTGGGVYYMIH